MNFKTKLIALIVIAIFSITLLTPVTTLAQEYKHHAAVLTHLENDEYLYPYDVEFDSQDNAYVVVEGYNYDIGEYEQYIVKLNPESQVLWAKRISEDYAYIYFIAYDEYSNKLFIAGEYYFNGGWHGFIAKLNANNGDFEKALLTLWTNSIHHWPSTIVPDGKGNIYVGDWVDYYSDRWFTGAYILKFDVEF